MAILPGGDARRSINLRPLITDYSLLPLLQSLAP
jgi:hypothetical protein